MQYWSESSIGKFAFKCLEVAIVAHASSINYNRYVEEWDINSIFILVYVQLIEKQLTSW